MKQPGKIVQLKDMRIGRTFDNQGLVAGKLIVYFPDTVTYEKRGNGILVMPNKLKIIGYID